MQAELAPVLQYMLEPLSDPGYLRAFRCDLPMTRHMLYHPLVSRVRMTGSRRTHDAIVWGASVRPSPPSARLPCSVRPPWHACAPTDVTPVASLRVLVRPATRRHGE